MEEYSDEDLEEVSVEERDVAEEYSDEDLEEAGEDLEEADEEEEMDRD